MVSGKMTWAARLYILSEGFVTLSYSIDWRLLYLFHVLISGFRDISRALSKVKFFSARWLIPHTNLYVSEHHVEGASYNHNTI